MNLAQDKIKSYDAIIIGSGVAGHSCAIRLSQKGLCCAIIEKDNLGGVCLNQGCIPTKTLAESARLFEKTKSLHEFGIKIKEVELDIRHILERKNKIVNQLRHGVNFLLNKHQIEIYRGEAVLLDKNRVGVSPVRSKAPGATAPPNSVAGTSNGVNDIQLQAKRLIIATGSQPKTLKGISPDGENILTSNDLLNLERLPKTILIIGAGAIGLEFAYIFNALGSRVIICEMMTDILPEVGDKDVSAQLEKELRGKGIEIKTGIVLKDIKRDNAKLTAVFNDESQLDCEKILLSVGRVALFPKQVGTSTSLSANPEFIERVGGLMFGGGDFIKVDQFFRTKFKDVYAIGDVIGGRLFAHKALHEGLAVAENITEKPRRVDYGSIPAVVYTEPQVAWVGQRHQELDLSLKRNGKVYPLGLENKEVDISISYYRHNARALCAGLRDGFVKLLADKGSKRILGGVVIGEHAEMLIQEIALAIEKRLCAAELAQMIHPHPTLQEMIQEASFGLSGKPLYE
ncbi:MAG: dihydrolipoyl dehydrogenase [Candidatus Omnitrophica bacterium]|nr:dihydrolipoyl dehydrogenase [Candidatus Omnitrophota bacterium]